MAMPVLPKKVPTVPSNKYGPFDWEDPLLLDSLLTEEERLQHRGGRRRQALVDRRPDGVLVPLAPQPEHEGAGAIVGRPHSAQPCGIDRDVCATAP